MGSSRFEGQSAARRLGIVLLFAALVFLLHVHTLRTYFLGDDFDILQLVAERTSFLDAARMTYDGNWGPVSYTQFWLNFRYGGLDPLGYRLVNLGWLTLTVAALFGFVRAAWPGAPFVAWAAALLFATHPVHDEAVTYICGRSHVVGTAMAIFALALYARSRLHAASATGKVVLFAGSVVAAFIAGLSKESALTVPAWIGAFEWLFVGEDGSLSPGRLARTTGSTVLFGASAASVFLLRPLLIGGHAAKLDRASGEVETMLEQTSVELPLYGLYGGVPIPFSWLGREGLEPMLWLGWLVVAAVVLAGLWLLYRLLVDREGTTTAARLFVLGLVITATTLAPVIYAGIPLRRRYLFIMTLGIVMIAAAVIERLHARAPRGARALLAVVVLAGAVGLVQRNELYRRSGHISRDFVETVVGAPDFSALRELVVITLPRVSAGDEISGAYLLHHTDVRSFMALHGVLEPELSYALKCHFAEDYHATARFVDDRELELKVRFDSPRAFRAAYDREARRDQRGNAVVAAPLEADEEARELTYRVRLRPGFWDDPGRALYLYSDRKLTRLLPGGVRAEDAS